MVQVVRTLLEGLASAVSRGTGDCPVIRLIPKATVKRLFHDSRQFDLSLTGKPTGF
jgi:hypothetical protein